MSGSVGNVEAVLEIISRGTSFTLFATSATGVVQISVTYGSSEVCSNANHNARFTLENGFQLLRRRALLLRQKSTLLAACEEHSAAAY